MDKIPFWRICLLTILATASLIIWTNTEEESRKVLSAPVDVKADRIKQLMAEADHLKENAVVLMKIASNYLREVERLQIDSQEIKTRHELIFNNFDFSNHEKWLEEYRPVIKKLSEKSGETTDRMKRLNDALVDLEKRIRRNTERMKAVKIELQILHEEQTK